MVHALQAGAVVALLAAVMGWFMVLRHQTFAGHTLSVVAFPGASAAALLGLSASVGYYAACAGSASLLARAQSGETRSLGGESAMIGSLQAAVLGLGFLFVSLSHTVLGGLDALLFGTFLGITAAQVTTLTLLAGGILVVVAFAARPLLFASIDQELARAHGVPVGAVSSGFLVLLGLTVAATAQITGALLVFALLVTPAATALTITARPLASLALAAGLALAVTWLGLAIAYFSPYPVGFWVTSLSFAFYVLVRAIAGRRGE
ncbi:MAG: zinc/manganese transport system permease protein [Solirubrobacteraceae bacterium]|nr:zinc/manganese transport system permease protein [Solirubrobacteraceae bacterium]